MDWHGGTRFSCSLSADEPSNSEITSLRYQDVDFNAGAHVRCLGKSSKMRRTPRAKTSLQRSRNGYPSEEAAHRILYPQLSRHVPSADALQRLVARLAAVATLSG